MKLFRITIYLGMKSFLIHDLFPIFLIFRWHCDIILTTRESLTLLLKISCALERLVVLGKTIFIYYVVKIFHFLIRSHVTVLLDY